MAKFLTDEGFQKELTEAEVIMQARLNYSSVDGYQNRLVSDLNRLHHYYHPARGDQWPEDAGIRPGKIHITSNYLKAVVDVDARVQAILPRITLIPDNPTDDTERRRAEAFEKTMMRYLELSGWDIWMADHCTIKSAYGRSVKKVFWNTDDDRPDVVVLENPANLRIGWGSDDYRVMDWTIFEYSISPLEAMRRYHDLLVQPVRGDKPLIVMRNGDHSDPLDQKLGLSESPRDIRRRYPFQPSDYENKQVVCWDYWYKDADGKVYNATIIGDLIADGVKEHPELPDIPYIVTENQHEPGSPTGVSTMDPLIDIQIELNRALSHMAQLIADEIDPAWQLTGVNADSILDGVIPRGGEIVPAGSGNEIKPIPKGVNMFPVQELINELKSQLHDISGLPQIMFGQSPGSQTTGRALAVQVEAAQNRLDFKRRRLYQGIKELLIFWSYMIEKVNPKINITQPDGTSQKIGLGDQIKGLRRWKIVAPEITPKDVIEHTTNTLNKLQAKTMSLRTAMDELGIDNPEDEIVTVSAERSDAHLYPGDALTFMQVVSAMAQLQAQNAAQAQQQAQSNAGPAAAQAQAQQATPALGQDQNNPQPGSAPGSPPPFGAPAPGGPVATTLLRANPAGGVQPLSQIAVQRKL